MENTKIEICKMRKQRNREIEKFKNAEIDEQFNRKIEKSLYIVEIKRKMHSINIKKICVTFENNIHIM